MEVHAALAFVREHGVVLVSARGPVPTLTEHIAGEPIRGSWWGHPEGKRIFAVLQAVSERPGRAGVPAGRRQGHPRAPPPVAGAGGRRAPA